VEFVTRIRLFDSKDAPTKGRAVEDNPSRGAYYPSPRLRPTYHLRLDLMQPIDVLAEAFHIRKQRLTVYPKHVELLQGVSLGLPGYPNLNQFFLDI